MNDIIKMILSALGAAAGAVAILASLGLTASALVAVLAGGVGFAVAALPALACLGGVAYAASHTGYGG